MVISLRVARILRLTAVASKAALLPSFAALSVASVELLDSPMEGMLFELSGASGRESMAFVVAIGRGSVCACTERLVDARRAMMANI
jgi:hypothetical protein